MIHECKKPIPCTTPLGDAYIWYIKDNGQFENDEYCCVLLTGGSIKHFLSDQVQIWTNATYGIQKEIPF